MHRPGLEVDPRKRFSGKCAKTPGYRWASKITDRDDRKLVRNVRDDRRQSLDDITKVIREKKDQKCAQTGQFKGACIVLATVQHREKADRDSCSQPQAQDAVVLIKATVDSA